MFPTHIRKKKKRKNYLVLSILEKYYQNGLVLKQTHPTLDLSIWNYSPKVQYEKLWDDVTKICRGLVTNSEGKIIARPFKKFFNYEEHSADEIPNESFEVFEKMDGSLGIVFYYHGEWHMATRGSFISNQSIVGLKMLKELSILKNYPSTGLNYNWTYLFEIIYNENRIVCDYDFEGLVLIGAYETESGNEIDFDILKHKVGLFDDVRIVRKYNGINDFKKLKETISDDREGYVIRFKNGFRIKIKGEEYIRLHRILTNISNRDIWEHLKDGKSLDEILDKVPDEFYNWVKETKNTLNDEFTKIENEYKWIYKIITRSPNSTERKVFAEYALKYKHSSILFSMYNKKDYKKIIWKLLYPSYSKPFKKDEN